MLDQSLSFVDDYSHGVSFLFIWATASEGTSVDEAGCTGHLINAWGFYLFLFFHTFDAFDGKRAALKV